MNTTYPNLRQTMREMKVSQEELAGYMGISRVELSYKLNGRHRFYEEEIYKICEYLNIPDSMLGFYFNREQKHGQNRVLQKNLRSIKRGSLMVANT